MALVVKNRVKETTATTGTGTLTLAGAVTGFQAFSSALSNNDTTYYSLIEPSTGSFEVGIGTFTASGTTLARTTILASSNSNNAINLTAGNAEVFITQPAEKAVFFDASGDVTLTRNPQSALQAATKQYVDTIAAAGLHYHDPVRVQTTGNLSATYSNGTSGVGATLTNSGSQAAISIDGVTLSSADRVLVSEQTNAAHNGIYTVTTVGTASTNWVLTRATDADSYGPSDPDALGQGDAFFIKEGDTNAGHLDVMNTSGTITFGTTNIVFAEVAETTVYSAGNGLTLSGTTFAAGAGTGVTVNANDIAIGQDVATTASPTFNTVTANLTGNVTGNVTGDVTGNADTASAWETARTVSLTGDVTGTATGVDGSGNISIATTYNNDVVLGTDTSGNYIATGAVSGNGLSGSASAEGATFTVTSNATNSNTASTIVFRDASGNFSAGTITANLSGVATNATNATNADTVDSLHASSFLRSDAADSASGTITISTGTNPALVAASDDWGEQLEIKRTNSSVNWPSIKFSNDAGEHGRVFVDVSTDYLMYVKNGGSNYETVWTSLTDGSGSGLDADTLDGVQGSSYLRSDANDTATGLITFQNATDYQIVLQGTNSWAGIQFDDSASVTDYIWYNGTYGTFAIGGSGSNVSGKKLHVDGGLSVGANSESTSTPSNGIYSEGQISVGGNTVWNAGNDGSGSGLDADTLDGQQGSYYIDTSSTAQTKSGNFTANGYLSGSTIYGTWFRAYGESGLYSESYGQHFYADSDGYYWESDGAIRVRDGHEGTIKLIMGYHDSGGAGFLNAGGSYWFYSNPSNNTHAILGGSTNYNPYNTVSSTRLMFGGGDTNAQASYYIGTNMENYGGNYTKLDLKWATGMRFYAYQSYGGFRFYEQNSGALLFSVGTGNTNVAVTNDLSVGGSLTVGGSPVGGGPSLTATASGAISNGDPCIVNSDGTVSAVATTSAGGTTGGAQQISNFGNQFYRNMVYDEGNNQLFAFYKGASNYSYGRIGTVSGNTITWGSRVTIDTGNSSYLRCVYDKHTGHVIVIYRTGSSAYARTISLSSGSFTTGSATYFNNNYASYMDICHDETANTNVVTFRTNTSNLRTILLSGNTSNTTIAVGNNNTFEANGGQRAGITYDASAGCCVIFYRKYYSSTNSVHAVTCTPGGNSSGSTSTFGTVLNVSTGVVIYNTNNDDVFPVEYDPIQQKVLVAYKKSTDNYGYCRVLSVSGTTISTSSETQFNNTVTNGMVLVYNTTSQNFALAFEDATNSLGKAVTATVSGTSVSFSSAITLDSLQWGNSSGAYDPDTDNVFFFYQRANNDIYYVQYDNVTQSTNLTSENYIGISDAAYSNGATATIQIVGSVDDAQSSLTAGQTYYIQNDGSLSTTAATPSVVAGTAVSATKLIVKG